MLLYTTQITMILDDGYGEIDRFSIPAFHLFEMHTRRSELACTHAGGSSATFGRLAGQWYRSCFCFLFWQDTEVVTQDKPGTCQCGNETHTFLDENGTHSTSTPPRPDNLTGKCFGRKKWLVIVFRKIAGTGGTILLKTAQNKYPLWSRLIRIYFCAN
jgi:hypothetical protein